MQSIIRSIEFSERNWRGKDLNKEESWLSSSGIGEAIYRIWRRRSPPPQQRTEVAHQAISKNGILEKVWRRVGCNMQEATVVKEEAPLIVSIGIEPSNEPKRTGARESSPEPTSLQPTSLQSIPTSIYLSIHRLEQGSTSRKKKTSTQASARVSRLVCLPV